MAPIPITLAPGRIDAISFATASVFSTLRPTMQAFAPRWTRARTCAEQMLPIAAVSKVPEWFWSRSGFRELTRTASAEDYLFFWVSS